LGALAIASESVAPLSISSQTSISEFFNVPGFDWFSRILRLRKMGNPASCKIDNWRVKVVRTLPLTRPIEKVFFRPPFFLRAPPVRAFLSEIFVTK